MEIKLPELPCSSSAYPSSKAFVVEEMGLLSSSLHVKIPSL